MDARATLSGSQRSTTRFPVTLVAAIVAALILGWFGGYLARGFAVATPSTNTITTPHPFVVEPAPYSSPATSPVPEPTHAPDGSAFTI